MLAVAQSRLAHLAGLQNEEGMPNYPFPSDEINTSINYYPNASIKSRYVVNYYDLERNKRRNQITSRIETYQSHICMASTLHMQFHVCDIS